MLEGCDSQRRGWLHLIMFPGAVTNPHRTCKEPRGHKAVHRQRGDLVLCPLCPVPLCCRQDSRTQKSDRTQSPDRLLCSSHAMEGIRRGRYHKELSPGFFGKASAGVLPRFCLWGWEQEPLKPFQSSGVFPVQGGHGEKVKAASEFPGV